jgi:cytochrome c oxidase subunit 3
LSLTLLLACVFLVVKGFEYNHKFEEGLLPGKFYTHQGDTVPGQFMFFSFYFMMTGLHGIHVLAGMGAISWLLRRALRGDFSSVYFGPVDLVGLYWHLVDMIWIYLFPLMYLIS